MIPKIPNYILESEIGKGGHAKVYKAIEISSQKQVAIKILHNNTDELLERFIREAAILSQEVNNKYVVQILEYNMNCKSPHIILEYCELGSLRNWVNNRDWKDIVGVIAHAIYGLQGIYSRGGFHRDIKPDNLLLGQEQDELIVKVSDFGVARIPEPNSTMTMTMQGTDGYIAPELYAGHKFTKYSDIYSLGITGIELLTGSINRDSIKTNTIIPNQFRNLLLQMTELEPSKRPDIQTIANTLHLIINPPPKKQQADEPLVNSNSIGLFFIFGGLILLALLAAGNSSDFDKGVSRKQ